MSFVVVVKILKINEDININRSINIKKIYFKFKN